MCRLPEGPHEEKRTGGRPPVIWLAIEWFDKHLKGKPAAAR
jgi:hypothetical protein